MPMRLFLPKEVEDYAFEHTRAEPNLLQDLALETETTMEMPQMLTGRVEGRLLKCLVQLCQPKLILEVGTFTGYSALSMAEALSEDGKIITCEIDLDAQRIAEKAFAASPHGHKVDLRMGPALETIKAIDQEIDFSFIDADKENYPEYYEAIVKKTRSGGVIVLDNMLLSGSVLDPQGDAGKAVAKLNDIIVNDSRVENVFLTIRDGIQLVIKK